MTDAELIAWMREHDYVPRIKAGADRIESLSARLKVAEEMAEALQNMISCTLGGKVGGGDGNTFAVYAPTGAALNGAQAALAAWKE